MTFSPARRHFFFIIAAAAFFLYGLGHLPLLGPDEPRYAEVAREMFERGDLVTPTLGGHTWFEKPALLYWMMMAGYRFFGVSEWSARLGPALCGFITVLLLYWLGGRIRRAAAETKEKENGGLGLWSGAAAASSAGMIVFSRAASFDVVVTCTVTAALASFFVAEIATNEKRRRFSLAGFYAAMGASLLAKGLVGIVIPFGIIGLYYLLRREWPRKSILVSALWGIPLTVAVAAVWYAPVIHRHGWTFVEEFFIQHHFARYVSDKYHHPQRFYFYLPIILLLTLPWTAFFIKGLMSARPPIWREQSVESRARVFALAWLVAPIAFFSFSGSKLPGYILPALPGAMLLIGERLSGFAREEETNASMRITGALLLLLALGGILYAARTGDVKILSALIITAPLVVAGFLAILWKQRRALRIELVCGAMFICIALILNFGIEGISRRDSVRDLMRLADERGYGKMPVFYMLEGERTAEFYAGGRLGYKSDGEPFRFDGAFEVAEAARQKGGTALVLIPLEWEKQLTDYKVVETEIIGRNEITTLALIRVRTESSLTSIAQPHPQ
jgi:4-amino-4-deoxy-L-arabinose transferase-like glycosyltransferase